jgi:hypothetical protein
MELDKLSIGKISDITNSNAEEFSRKVKELDPTVDDLKALKEAEENGQNREELLTFLNNQLTSKNVSNYLGIAEQSIDNLDGLIRQIEDVEDIQHFEEKNLELEQDDLIDLVGGTVPEMKEFVEEKKLTEGQLQNILDAEKRVKNRKTAKKFLKKNIRRQEIGKDVEDAREDLDNLEEDIEEIKDDEDREIELEDPEKDIENEEDDEKDAEDEKEDGSDETEDKEDIEGEDTSEPEEEKDTEENEESEEDSGDDEDVESDEGKDEFEEKKELVDDLDLDLSDEEIEDISLKQLKDIRDEKEHREELIDRLKDEGMDEEDLRDSSTSDLEKVVEGLDSSSEESQEEHEEMREEAEEDLEMLMGAVKEEEEEEQDSSKDAREKFEDFTEAIRDKLHRSEDEEEESSSGINAENVQEVLDQYRELDAEEASVKTAHIMKGYLEQRLGIEREMTYKELADKMPVEEDESIDELAEFFVKMHREQYTGTFNIEDADEIIDTCDRVIEKLG